MLKGYYLGEDHIINNVLTKCTTQNIWFERFMRGVDLRVGSKSRPDQKISTEMMKLLMENIEVAVKGRFSMLERGDLTQKRDQKWVVLWNH